MERNHLLEKFDVYFDILVWPMSFLLTLSGRIYDLYAVSHQGTAETLWLRFCGAVILSSICRSAHQCSHRRFPLSLWRQPPTVSLCSRRQWTARTLPSKMGHGRPMTSSSFYLSSFLSRQQKNSTNNSWLILRGAQRQKTFKSWCYDAVAPVNRGP